MRKNKERGITLIALIITIIILLILAGTTINTIFGENGIIKMAQKAKNETERASEETEEQLNELIQQLGNSENNQKEIDIEITKKKVTSNSIEINVMVTSKQLELVEKLTYKYYIKESSIDTYLEKPTETTDAKNYIKVEITDNLGNTCNKEIKNIITNKIVSINDINVGDYINYDCTTSDETYTSTTLKSGWKEEQVFKASEYKYGWRVLGRNNEGQLMIISEELVQPSIGGTEINGRIYYMLYYQLGYVNGVSELNNICRIYGNGVGATAARCITIEDINRITGYNPNNVGVKDTNQTGRGKKYGQGTVIEYGNSITYTKNSQKVGYKSANGLSEENSIYSRFDYLAGGNTWRSLSLNQSVTINNSNMYIYYPTTLTNIDDKTATKGISTQSKEYEVLFKDSEIVEYPTASGNMFRYWLASDGIMTGDGNVFYCIRNVFQEHVDYTYTFETGGTRQGPTYGIRPIVTLSNTIQLEDTNTQKNDCKVYDLII